MKKTFFVLGVFFFFYCFLSINAHAVELEAGDWKFGINGFLDGEYTYMDSMPTVKSGNPYMTETMPDSSYFDQHHLNLLFGAEKDRMRVNINLKSHNAFFAEDGETKGELEFEEAYGVYTFNDYLKLYAGAMLPPFGIYNDVRYITSLFSSVVLPQMYLMPENYRSGNDEEDESISKNLMPTHNANLMLTGDFSQDEMELNYSFYASNGERGENGIDVNKDKGFGGRLRAAVLENYKIGVSYFTVNNDDVNIGREHLIGFDTELNFFSEKVKLEFEYVLDQFKKRAMRRSYYVRLTGYAGKFSPFISYDFFKDRANSIYKRGQARYSIGTGYSLSDYVMVKAEYHFHKISNKNEGPALPGDTDTNNMFRSSIIFIF